MWCVIDTSKTVKTKQKQNATENTKHKTKQTNKQAKKKNILPSLTQILTQRFQSVLSPPLGNSHSEVFPKTRIT